jgi:hypothetical protein
MAETIDEITINYYDNDIQVVKELDKSILTRGAWTTIVFKFQEWDPRKEEYGPIKYTIRRYQKRNNNYMMQSKFNISNVDQANKIIETLQAWVVADSQPVA